MLRKLVSFRLLDNGRTHQGKSLHAYPVPSRQNIWPSESFGLTWYSQCSCVCTGFEFGVI